MWETLPDGVRHALAAGWAEGVPPTATALYTRWWQLETWLREVAYVELRARDGLAWAEALQPEQGQTTVRKMKDQTVDRQKQDRRQRHMLTPDAEARLAYLDTGPLFDLLDDNWPIFEHALLDDRAIWAGRVVELRKIRNRIGHCRRPHGDDLGRVEQTLRDLDNAAFLTVASYNRQWETGPELADPLVKAWIDKTHSAARRLVDHADQNKDVSFSLGYSRRPWAEGRGPGEPVSGRSGYLWHATWYLRRSSLEPRTFWQDALLDESREMIVYAGFDSPSTLMVSFAAVDDPGRIADAIGDCFDAVMINHSYLRTGDPRSLVTIEDDLNAWIAANSNLDPRLQVASAWTIVDDTMTGISMFRA